MDLSDKSNAKSVCDLSDKAGESDKSTAEVDIDDDECWVVGCTYDERM